MNKRIVLACAAVIAGAAVAAFLITDSDESPKPHTSFVTAADALPLTLISQTATTLTLGWTPVSGFGYLYSTQATATSAMTLVSRTNSASASSVKFSKGSFRYEVAAITKGATGTYDTTTPPPPPDTTVPVVSLTAPVDGTTVSGTINVAANASDNIGVTRVDFFRDGVLLGQDATPPYLLTFNTVAAPNGATTFGARAYDTAGNVGFATQASVTINNTAPPPTAACSDGLDNEVPPDGLIDYPADPGCTSLSDNDESNTVPPPPGGNVFVATNGNDSNPCTQAAPCLTFNRAYSVAANGDTVEVAGGSYGAQYIQRDEKYTTSDTPDVTIQPAAGATVTVADLQIGKWGNVCGSGFDDGNAPSNLTVRNIADNQTAAGVNCSQNGGGSNDCEVVVGTLAYWVTLENLDFCNVQMVNAHQVKVLGGDWGPCTAPTGGCSNMKMVDNTTNVLWDGAYIHDIRIVPGSGAHLECMFLGPGSASFITIQNSKFTNCEFYDIFVQPAGPNGVHDVTIQNNWFDTPFSGGSSRGLWAIGMSARSQPFSNFLIRFNSFHETSIVDFNNDGDNQTHQNVRFVGNVAHVTSCYPSVSYSYNTMVGVGARTCGTGDAVSGNVYVNSGFLGLGGDFHLTAGTAAEGRVTGTGPDQLLNFDIDGQTRSAPRDSGSDER